MKRGAKLLLGVLSFMPLALLIIYVGLMIPKIADLIAMQQLQPPQASATYFLSHFSSLLLLVIVSLIINISLIIYYLLHLITRTNASNGEKALWIVIFAFVSIIALPIYFFAHIAQNSKAKMPVLV